MIWRKLIYFYVCLLLFVNLCRSQNHVVDEDLQNFLHNRLKYTNNQLTSLLDQSSYTKDVQTNIESYTAKTDILPHPYVTANIFSLFNDTYVFLDVTLYYIVPLDNTVALNERDGFAKIEENISFIKTFEYNNLGVIFIALPTGYSHIYGYSNRQWFFIQSIYNADRAIDAKFFVNQNNLYLIIANTVGDALTPTSIYKWTETHFDETDKVLTKDAAVVLSFNNGESEIIIILQNSPSDHKHNLIVYGLNNDHLKKQQLLLTHNSKHIISYEFKGYRYLVNFEETENSTLYWWDGSEFVPWVKFDNYKEIQKSLLAYIDEIPIIFLIQKDRMLLFSHSLNNLCLISKTKISESYEKILDMQLISSNNTNMILLFMLTSEKQLKYMTFPFTVDVREMERKPPGTDVLLQCLLNLEQNVEITNRKLDSITKSSEKIIQTNEPLEYKGRINVGAAVRADSANINLQFTSTRFQHQAVELKDKLNTVNSRINTLNPKIDTLFREGDLIHGQLIVRGELHAEKLLAKNLHVQFLNGVRWTPDIWLSYSKPQTITGPVLCKELYAKNLDVSEHNEVLNNFAFQNGSQNVENLSLLNSLTANNIFVGKINDIPFEDVYLRSESTLIKGAKKFENLSVNKMEANYLNEKAMSEAMEQLSDITSGNLLFAPDLNIKNFNFEKINDVHWNSFKDSVFRIGVTNRITGSLTGNSIKANQLYAKAISKIDTSALLTATTNQIVTSTLQFSNVDAQGVVCNKINNVNLEKETVTSENNIIRGPVSIDNMQINGNLHIDGPAFSVKVEDDHVIGTSESDLLQIYNNKVKIIGNLQLSNIQVSNMAKVIVNDQEFNQNLSASYWLKSHNQEIPIHFEAQNGISTPHLTTSLLNNFIISSYMVNNLDDKPPINLIFENATILGNVIINQTLPHSPDLKRLDAESVKTTGSYNINGHKAVQGKISIGNLITNYLDEVRISDVLSSRYSGKIQGIKVFDNLIVAENILSNSITTDIVNNMNLEILKEAAFYVDKPEDVDILRFTDVTAQNVFTSYVNKNNFDQHLTHLDDIYKITMLNDVLVNGNVQIKSTQQLSHINNHDVNNLLANVLKHEGNIIFENNVRFLGNVYAENIEVKYVNNINFPVLVENLLYRNWDQNITAQYSFDQLNTPNIFVPQVNNIITENLINTKNPNPQNLLAWGGLQLFQPKFLKSVYAESLICNLKEVIAVLKNPPSRYWNTVHVSQNITLWDDYSDLNVILKKSVNSKRNNIIDAQVVFEHHISANTVYLQKLINGVDINEIISDAVLRTVAEQQIITGRKRFDRFAASSITVGENADIPIINDIIDIVKLDESIIHKNDIGTTLIRGPKVFFGGLQGNRLMTNKISDLDPLDLISLEDVTIIPKAYFHSLEIDNNLDIEYVNGLNMRNILRDRLFRFHKEQQVAYGTYYFEESAYIIGDSNISTINDVAVDDIVLDVGTQIIPSRKTFTKNLSINGSIGVGLLNGRNLSESYEQAILLGESNNIKGSIKFNNVSSITGNINANSINGISTDSLKELMHSKAPIIKAEIINNITEKMSNIFKRSSEMSEGMPNKYLYLEKSSEIQIPISNVISAYSYEHNNTVMLHVIQRERGSRCGLPEHCICPIQETIQITPQPSVNYISKTYFQRTFSYDAEGIVVHLFTNTISTSEACRANESTAFNELTSISLMVELPNGSRPVFFSTDEYMGYVSAVRFFHYNGYTYMIVSRFYDPINNTHKLHCFVYKFIKELGEISLVQQLDCNGAWTLYLFHTTQGITLVIGSIFNSDKITQETGAEIYRFNPVSEEFMLLRKVLSTGCNAAAGVVVNSDSLVILAHKTSLEIYKYHPKYDNYYFYQSIFLDSTVTGISVFYTAGFGISDAYLCVVTESGIFYIYSFQYIAGWQVVSNGEIEGLQSLVPFVLNRKHYLFAVSSKVSYVLTVIKQGSN